MVILIKRVIYFYIYIYESINLFNIKMKWKKLLLLLILSPIISIALIVILNELAWAFSSNEVSSVEVVEFFPTYMYLNICI